ncbi:imm11 family protein [Breznakiellaceae bacterium SP9]
MANEFDYYLLFSGGIPNSPTVIFDDETDEDDVMVEEPIDLELITMKFWEPYPKKPVMVDFHDGGGMGVVSQKIYEALSPMKIKGIQLILATIFDPKNKKTYGDYYFLHIHNYLECLDKDKSVYKASGVGTILYINKMVLDTTVLSKIPLEDRLIFHLGEMFTHQLFHKSIVDVIMAVNPEGIRFVNVTEYNAGSAFD